MIPTEISEIARLVGGDLQGCVSSTKIERICIDSRETSPKALFIALQGQRTDGHFFLSSSFQNGASGAIVTEATIAEIEIDPDWPLIVVPSTLEALQSLARWFRQMAFDKVLAITGSNGKTIVKDALKALFSSKRILASPGSYNSKVGLPLAILAAERRSELAILEVGVSEPHTMACLEDIARPNFGVLTNIGMAHLASFGSREAIAREKMELFRRIPEDGWVLLPANEPTIASAARQLKCQVYEVGSDRQVLSLAPSSSADDGYLFKLSTRWGQSIEVRIEAQSPHIISDLHFAASAAYLLGMRLEDIAAELDGYLPTPTRLELWSSSSGIRIINDAYSSDPISVRSALQSAALGAPLTGRKIFVFAGINELGENSASEHLKAGTYAGECGFTHLYLVGDGDLQHTATGFRAAQPNGSVVNVENAEELTEKVFPKLRWDDTVLFKGPFAAGLVKAARNLTGSVSQRCLWVDLAAIEGNLTRFRRHTEGRAGILAMLKALAYGTELVQLSFWLSRLGIQQIGVSSANEGISIRKAGILQDIFVFLCDRDDIDNLVRYGLTPVLYSAELVEVFIRALAERGNILGGRSLPLDVHLKLDTGMHRLGVNPEVAVEIARRIRDSGVMRLTGICTHFAAADDPGADEFTLQQIRTFDRAVEALRAEGFENLQIHAANTAATVRFPQAHYNMVRIGLGLYGIYPSNAVREAMDLELAIGVTSRFASLQEFPAGAKLGYHGTYVASRKIMVGVIPFGYDDGLPWRLSGAGQVLVEGIPAPLVGSISMDQAQVDVTGIPGADVGREVLIYGSHGGHVLRPEHVAECAGTIPHELLIRLGRRVQRIYIEP